MDKKFLDSFTKGWLESWNSHEIDLILRHYSEDVEVESPLALQRFPESKGKIIGKENVKEYWVLGLKLNPKLEFEMIHILNGVNSISVYYLSKATNKKVIKTMVFNADLKVCKAIVCYE